MKRLLVLLLISISLYSCDSDTAFISYNTDSPIYPDYRDVTVPLNIAPLNFCYVNAESDDITTVFYTTDRKLVVKGKKVIIKPDDWRELMDSSVESGYIDVKSNAIDDPWKIYVSPDGIDYAVTYRLVPPGYEAYKKLGIYEYDFGTATQRPLLENEVIGSNCINCHSFKENDPSMMCLHIRGDYGGTLLNDNGNLKVFNTMTEKSGGNCVYPYWHPSGGHIAFSVNKTKQSFYVNPDKLIEVYDIWSDMWVYNIRKNRLFTCDALCGDEYYETFPAFSEDGNWLYFCRSIALDSLGNKEDLHYDLCRVAFNAQKDSLGSDVETLIDSRTMGKSVLFPRPSYDGRYLVYTLCDYGTFPIWHKESDLWIMDLRDGSTRPLEGANSPDTESYHSWSRNSRWLVFSSRRDDTRFTRLYVCHIDENGEAAKAFMLPQKDPVKYYNSLFSSYNVPDFVSGPVKLPRYRMLRSILSHKRESFSN